MGFGGFSESVYFCFFPHFFSFEGMILPVFLNLNKKWVYTSLGFYFSREYFVCILRKYVSILMLFLVYLLGGGLFFFF